jgi:hypothetical protein
MSSDNIKQLDFRTNFGTKLVFTKEKPSQNIDL